MNTALPLVTLAADLALKEDKTNMAHFSLQARPIPVDSTFSQKVEPWFHSMVKTTGRCKLPKAARPSFAVRFIATLATAVCAESATAVATYTPCTCVTCSGRVIMPIAKELKGVA